MTHAKISRPAKTAMQSGRAKTGRWLLEYQPAQPGTPDALMGWNSMSDTITEVKLWFDSREEAIAYATAKNIPFAVSEPKEHVVRPKASAENFSFARRRAFGAND